MDGILSEELLYIGGEWRPAGGGRREVECPATEAVVGIAAEAAPADVDAAVEAGLDAGESWGNASIGHRVELLRRLHAILLERADRFAELVSAEQGSPPLLARRLHVDVPLSVIEQTIAALTDFEFERELNGSLVLHQPSGVVAAITPWNLPLHQVVTKVVPAIAAGCAVVLKPSELTPLTAFEFARAVSDAGFPAGVFNLVPGSGAAVGSYLAGHHGVSHVSFTGSTDVGRQVAVAAAKQLKRVTLELGGKSASIVLSDVDDTLLATAVKMTIANCFLNGGQTCTALSRLIVPADLLPRVEELALANVGKYELGTRLGPLISAAHRERVRAFMSEDATAGAKVLSGGLEAAVPSVGYYVAPTILSGIDPTCSTAREEVFGPVLSVIVADTDEGAIRLANESAYGLTGAVWSSDSIGAERVARRLAAGQIDINGAGFNPRAPFGGWKDSGIGRELGEYGMSDVLEVKSIQS